MTTNKPDLFATLDKIQTKDRSVLDQNDLPAPYLLQRWLSGVKDPAQIIIMNDLVNEKMFALKNHPRLLVELMMVSSSGDKQRLKWIKPSNTTINQLVLEVISQYYNITYKDAKSYAKRMTSQQILDAAVFVGLQPDEFKQLKKQLE